MSKRAEKTVTIGGHEIEIRTLPNFPNALSIGYPWMAGVDVANGRDVTVIREIKGGVSEYVRSFQADMDYTRQLISNAFGVPPELVPNTQSKMKTNFPIGAEVYVRDDSYAKNLATGRNDNLANRGASFENKRKCRVLSTPFKARIEGYPSLGRNNEYEFVLVQPAESAEVHQVLNDLEDAGKIRVQLNDYHIAELSAEHPGYIKVGCQKISFEKVKELYEVIFKDRKPEPVDESRRKVDFAGLRMDWERQRYGFPVV